MGSSEAQSRHGKGLTGKVVQSNELARTITQLHKQKDETKDETKRRGVKPRLFLG
jgi:hypothetical protein